MDVIQKTIKRQRKAKAKKLKALRAARDMASPHFKFPLLMKDLEKSGRIDVFYFRSSRWLSVKDIARLIYNTRKELQRIRETGTDEPPTPKRFASKVQND